jgi:formiminotetrahydrofolate cyclodeaminase
LSGPGEAGGYLELPLAGFLGALAEGVAAPGGGSAAATAVAMGAGLCAMTARLSVAQLGRAQADVLAAEADRLRSGAAALIQADADGYGRVLEAQRLAAPDAAAARARADAVAHALAQASVVPAQVAELAAEVVRIAVRLAAEGNPNLRGDVATGLALAEAGASAAKALVEINLAGLCLCAGRFPVE